MAPQFDREDKNREDDTMIFGIRPVLEALDSGKEIERIFVQRDLNNPLSRELKSALAKNNIVYTAVPIEKLNRLTRKNHQGVVCFLSQISYCKIEDIVSDLFGHTKFPLVVMLDRITDVRNFGAICRSAECMGVDAVIVPEKGGAPVNGDAIKASAGALHRMPVCREFNLKKTIDFLKDSGFTIAGCTEKADKPLYQENLDKPLCIIMGSEEDGISPEYLKRCDLLLRIPTSGKTLSLNVSVAAGILLYEINRQRK